MPKATSSFPPDEFDAVDPTAPRSPHRAPKTLAQRLLPFLVAIVLGPLLAYVVVTAVSTGDLPGRSVSTQEDGDTVTPTVDDLDEDAETTPPGEGETTDEATDDETETETEEAETEEAEPTADPDVGTAVLILNSTGTSGLAGRAQDALESAGWLDVSTGNYSGALSGSTVFYAEDDPVLEASARAVARELDIDVVELDADEATSPITVVLEADFTP